MAEADRDPACVERWPGAASGEFDPRCCRFPKSCSADLPAVDPEVERLARVCADADAGSPQPHPIDNDRRIVTAVLADLRKRYILVPREGASEGVEWGERSDRTGQVWRSPEESARINTQDAGWTLMRRPVIRGPWEPAP